MTDNVVQEAQPAAPAPTPEPTGASEAEQFKPIDLDAPPQSAAPEPKPNLPEGADVGQPAEAAPSETAEPSPAELPPIEAPRSWSKEDKELFASLPRETQERVAERERSRERDFLQRQQQTNERLKALEAETQRAAQLRAQYEQNLPTLVATMQSQIAGEFADVKNWGDVERLQSTDPDRFQRYQIASAKLQGYQRELGATQQRQAAEMAQQWQQFSQEQDAKFAEQVPEITDPEKGKTLRASAEKYLLDRGFGSDEMQAAWLGRTGISLRDHRVQQIILDATRWRQAQAKAHSATQASTPRPLTPGPAQAPRGAGNDLQNAAEKGDMETYFALRAKGRVR